MDHGHDVRAVCDTRSKVGQNVLAIGGSLVAESSEAKVICRPMGRVQVRIEMYGCRERIRTMLIGIAFSLGILALAACGDPPGTTQSPADQTPTVQQTGLRPRAATATTVSRDAPAEPIPETAAAPTTYGSAFVQVANGENHTCALRGDGRVVCWGTNDQGQLDAPEDARFQQITSGWRFSCGIQIDGTLKCWGRNNHQQADPPEGTFQAVDAGWDHACALSGTTATCWGRNANARATPPSDVEFTAIGAGAEHSCGLSSSGGLVCWGKNDDGRADSLEGPFSALAVGIAHTCVLNGTGTAECQGDNSAGQSEPPGIAFSLISAGSNHSCGTLATGYVECWGGQATEAQNVPFGPTGRFRSLSAGWTATCATNRDGQVACWPTTVRVPQPEPYGALGLADISLGQTFSQPTEVFPWPDGGLAVADRAGSIVVLTSEPSITTVLDMTDTVSTSGAERGLLTAAIDPQFEDYRFIYLYYTMESPKDKDLALARLSRFPIIDGLPVREQELVMLELPRGAQASGHYGGAIRFGPDGMLYLGIGDAACFECPQSLESLFGKIIRIDVRGATVDMPYRVPDDNPMRQLANARPEIWAYGLRNPWRMSFDSSSGELWVGDVGDRNYEEIALVTKGANLGWPIVEGYDCFELDESSKRRYGTSATMPCQDISQLTEPTITYEHEGKCAIVGGIVYRGSAIPWLTGTYLFGDYCSGQVWALDGDADSGWRMIETVDLATPLSSFGVDAKGEVLVLTFGGPVLRLIAVEADLAPMVTHVPSATIVTMPTQAGTAASP